MLFSNELACNMYKRLVIPASEPELVVHLSIIDESQKHNIIKSKPLHHKIFLSLSLTASLGFHTYGTCIHSNIHGLYGHNHTATISDGV